MKGSIGAWTQMRTAEDMRLKSGLQDSARATSSSPKFEVNPKASYILSFWEKSDRPSTANAMLLFDSHPAGFYHYDAKPKFGTRWRRASGVFPILENSTTYQVRFAPTGAQRFYLDDV